MNIKVFKYFAFASPSLGMLIPNVHSPGLQMELHCFKNVVGLLIVIDTSVQLRKLRVVLSHLGNVVDSMEHQDTVSKEEPSDSSRWALKKLTKIKRMSSTSSRHHVYKSEWHG